MEKDTKKLKTERFLDTIDTLIAHRFAYSQRELSKTMGLNENYVNNIRNGKANVSTKAIEKLCEVYEIVNKDYILTGEGEPLHKIYTSSVDTWKHEEFLKKNEELRQQNEELHFQNEATVSGRFLPLIPFNALAGALTVDNEGVTYEDCPKYFVPDFAAKGAEFLINVSGDSMLPKYNSGDILACRKIQDITFFQWGKCYVIDTCQGVIVKRVFEDKDNKDNIICVSENKDKYSPFSLPKTEIRSLSIVVGAIGLE